jgi:PAS domain S-box-containing protein
MRRGSAAAGEALAGSPPHSTRLNPRSSHGAPLAIALGYVAGYVFLDWVSYIHPVAPYAITPWNPPPGLSLAMLLALGLRYAPLLLVAAILAEVIVRGTGASVLQVLGYAAILAAGYTGIAACLIRYARFDARLSTLRDLSAFTATVTSGAAVIAMVYVAAHVLAGRFTWDEWPLYALRFWVGDVIGIVVLTPLLLVYAQRVRNALHASAAETALQAVAILIALAAVFRAGDAAAARYFYLLFLPLIWISVRRGFKGATTALLATQLGLIAATQFAGYASSSVLELQLLMLALSITALFLGMAVTEWRRVRTELERREAELNTVVSTAPDGIFSIDDAGRIMGVNGAGASMLGASVDSLAGAPFVRFVADLPRDLSRVRAAPARATRWDGTMFPVEVSVGSTASGSRPAHIAIVRDMSERKAIEEQLQDRDREIHRAMRVAAAAEMASALAHELNQPLTAASSYVQACDLMLRSPGGADGRLSGTMRKAVGEVKRAAEVVRRLRNVYRGGEMRSGAWCLEDLCRAVLHTLHDRLQRHGVAVSLDVPPGLPRVKVDRVQLEMVLHNLYANAIDSMTASGSTTRAIQVTARPASEGFVQVTVRDTGPGIALQDADRLFKAFATSKTEGMGLGLAISRSIIEQHGGRLWLESAAPGAAFAFTVPLASMPAP